MAIRRYPRIEVEIPARFTCHSDKTQVDMNVSDLSLGGCRLSGDGAFDCKGKGSIELEIEGVSIKAGSKIVHGFSDEKSRVFGVSFDDLSPKHYQRLKSFITSHLLTKGSTDDHPCILPVRT